MKSMLRNLVSGDQPGTAPYELSQLLRSADRTMPGSRVERLPMEALLSHIDRANSRVVDCDAELMLIETAHAKACEDYQVAMTEGHKRLQDAIQKRAEAQGAFIKVCKQHAVFEGMEDIQRAIQDA